MYFCNGKKNSRYGWIQNSLPGYYSDHLSYMNPVQRNKSYQCSTLRQPLLLVINLAVANLLLAKCM